MRKTMISLAILVVLAGFSGCQRSIEPKAQAQVISREAITDIEVEAKEVHYCKGVTAKGERCKRHVKADGAYCWQHEIQANPCWRPKGSKPKEDCYYKDGDVTRPIEGKP